METGENASEKEEYSLEHSERKQKFRELLADKETGEMPAAAFILSAGIKLVETRNGETQYKTKSYADLDIHGLTSGCKSRTMAAGYLGQEFPELKFVTNSGFQSEAAKGIPSHAQVMEQELKKFNVPDESIILQEKSVSTATEMVKMIKLAVDNNWQKIAIITSDYHIPRTRALFANLADIINYEDPEFREKLAEFKKRNIRVSFVSAEDVLENVSPLYKHLIAKAKQTESYKKRVEQEQNGLKDIEEGKYRVYQTL